jgi:hypothetical protein
LGGKEWAQSDQGDGKSAKYHQNDLLHKQQSLRLMVHRNYFCGAKTAPTYTQPLLSKGEPTNRRDRGSRTTGFPADDSLILNLAVPGEAYREDVTSHFMTIELYAFTSTPDRLVAAAVQKAAHIKLRKNGSNEGSVGLWV